MTHAKLDKLMDQSIANNSTLIAYLEKERQKMVLDKDYSPDTLKSAKLSDDQEEIEQYRNWLRYKVTDEVIAPFVSRLEEDK